MDHNTEGSPLVPDSLESVIGKIERLQPESRLGLMLEIAGGIALNRDLPMDAAEAIETAAKTVEHFEVVTTAMQKGFIRSIDRLIEIDGYSFRILQPDPMPSEEV